MNYTFRAKNKETGIFEFAKLNHILWKDGIVNDPCFIRVDNEGDVEWINVDKSTIGLWSGLKDKNEVYIFEGDIVKGLFRYGQYILCECVFQEGAFGVRYTRKNPSIFNKDLGETIEYFQPFTSFCNIEWEIVGNVYDNHELLEVEE